MAVECLKSQQLGLPAQDLHKTRVINTVMGPTLPPPPPEGLFVVNGCLEREREFLQWCNHSLGAHAPANDLMKLTGSLTNK